MGKEGVHSLISKMTSWHQLYFKRRGMSEMPVVNVLATGSRQTQSQLVKREISVIQFKWIVSSEAADLFLNGFFPHTFSSHPSIHLVTAHLLPNRGLGHRSLAALWALRPFVDGEAGQALDITNCWLNTIFFAGWVHVTSRHPLGLCGI